MKMNMNQFKWMRGLGNASYIIGAAFLIAALMTSIVPAGEADSKSTNLTSRVREYKHTDLHPQTTSQYAD